MNVRRPVAPVRGPLFRHGRRMRAHRGGVAPADTGGPPDALGEPAATACVPRRRSGLRKPTTKVP
jgi:hypothetical protein